GCPRSWLRHAVSTTSAETPRALASSRPTCATSSEWVRRLRAKSAVLAGLSTWVFAASRRSAAECSTRARSREKSSRSDRWVSAKKRSASCSSYPAGTRTEGSAATVLDLRSAHHVTDALPDLAGVEPALRKRRALGRTGTTALALGAGARIRGVAERSEKVVDLLQGRRTCESRPQLTADRVALEVPGDVLADVLAAAILVLEEVDQELSVPAERLRHELQRRVDLRTCGSVVVRAEGVGELAEQPRP